MSAPAGMLSRPHHSRGLALMLFSTGCFTVNVLLIRALGELQHVNVWLISSARFVVGLGVLSAVYWREVSFGRLFRRKRLIGRGLVGGLGVAIFYATVVHLGAGRATFINNTYIPFGAVLAAWVLHERLTPALVIGGLAGLAGLALLTDAFAGGFQASRYDLLAIIGALASAYIVVTIRQLHHDGEHTSTIFAAQCVYGLLICGIPAGLHPEPVSWTAAGIMLLAGIAAAAGQLAMTRGFRDLPVAEGSLLQILVPLGIAAGGYAFFAERFMPHEWLGAALIVAGTIFTVLARPARQH